MYCVNMALCCYTITPTLLIILYMAFIRHKQGSRKVTAMELASIDSKEQDATTSVDNTYYDTVSSELNSQPFIGLSYQGYELVVHLVMVTYSYNHYCPIDIQCCDRQSCVP